MLKQQLWVTAPVAFDRDMEEIAAQIVAHDNRVVQVMILENYRDNRLELGLIISGLDVNDASRFLLYELPKFTGLREWSSKVISQSFKNNR